MLFFTVFLIFVGTTDKHFYIDAHMEQSSLESFEGRIRRKLAGWYSKKEYEDKAVARIIAQRNEIITLLESTGRQGIDEVLRYLDDSGFYYRASSAVKHHNWPGGLAEHSLGTCKIALQRAGSLPRDSVIIASMLHDTCKSDRFWFRGRSIRQHTPKCELDGLHSVRSIAILKECGLVLTEYERLAIRWHMKGERYHSRNHRKEADHNKAVKTPLWKVVFYADKDDAKAHPAGRVQRTV